MSCMYPSFISTSIPVRTDASICDETAVHYDGHDSYNDLYTGGSERLTSGTVDTCEDGDENIWSKQLSPSHVKLANQYIETSTPCYTSDLIINNDTPRSHHVSEIGQGESNYGSFFTVNNVPLSEQKEIRRLLDPEPLLSYLLQNGVITPEQEDIIRCLDDMSDQNLTLLQYLETKADCRQLFVNALRLSGQHYLANLLDDTARIKAFSGSGYLSTSRHKGEVCVKISVVSMKLTSDTFRRASTLLHKDWISLEDIQSKISSLKRLHSQKNHNKDVIVTLPSSTVNVDDVQQSCCASCCFCCFCCCCCPKHTEKKHTDRELTLSANGHQDIVALANHKQDKGEVTKPLMLNRSSQDLVVVTAQPASRMLSSCAADSSLAGELGAGPAAGSRVDQLRHLDQQLSEQLRQSVESLREVANVVQEKSECLYSVLCDTDSSLHATLLRYFEQDRGVLVLGMDYATDGATISCICTKLEHLVRLREDLTVKESSQELTVSKLSQDMATSRYSQEMNKLSEDVERIVLADGVTEDLDITGVKLSASVCDDNLETAYRELQ